jgi:hypothetical protein
MTLTVESRKKCKICSHDNIKQKKKKKRNKHARENLSRPTKAVRYQTRTESGVANIQTFPGSLNDREECREWLFHEHRNHIV